MENWVKRDKALHRDDGLILRRRCDNGKYSLECGFSPESGHRLHERDVFNILNTRYENSGVQPAPEPGWLHFPRWNGMLAIAQYLDTVIERRA